MTFSKTLLDQLGNSHLATLSDADLLRAYAATHDDDAFRAALEAPSSSVRSVDRRRPFRTRTAR